MAGKPNTYTESYHRRTRGELMACALAGSWREAPPPLELSASEISEITQLLLKSGSGAMVWRRLKDSGVLDVRLSFEFERAYRVQLLDAAVHGPNIGKAFALFRDAGIEPVLVKGWAIARRYPEGCLRPYGDIDLCVRASQFREAESVLKSTEGRKLWIDLHEGFSRLDSRDEDELYARSQLVRLGESTVRVLSEEDHLRVLCLHLLRHGAWRPLWLCDVSVALETRSESFNWKLFLGDDKRESDWLACVIGLAHQLLGANISYTPVAERAAHLPRWLVGAVLRQWSRVRNPNAEGMALPTILTGTTEPKRIFGELYARWDNPVRATAVLGGRFNNWPRLPYQLAELVTHSAEVPKQLRTMLKQQSTLQMSVPSDH